MTRCQNAVVMLVDINHDVEHEREAIAANSGGTLRTAISDGAALRVRPVAKTIAVIITGF